MRRGEDRHDVGEQVAELLFPEGSAFVRDIAIGTPLAEVVAREPSAVVGGGHVVLSFDIDDAFDNKRHIEVRLAQQVGRALHCTAFFRSKDRLDIDSAYRIVRKHLEKQHGRPSQERGGNLKFVYAVTQGEFPARISVCRYRHDGEVENVLEVSCKAEDGVRFPHPGKKVSIV